jgi:hypothetical protein
MFKIELISISEWLFLFFCFFPYIKILPLGTDSQPTALLISFVLFFLHIKNKVSKDFVYLCITFLFSMCILFVDPSFNSLRSFGTYVSVFFIPIATFWLLKNKEGLDFILFKRIVYIWFFVGAVQLFFYPDFLSFLIPRGNVEHLLETGRGVLSLAPEPTYYGIICILLLIIGHLNFESNKLLYRIDLILLIQVIFLAKSSLSIMILFGSVLFYCLVIFLKQKIVNKLKTIFVLSLLLLVTYYLLLTLIAGENSSRVISLLRLLFESPSLFLVLDESVNERFIHLFFPIYGFITNIGFPHFYNEFGNYLSEIIVEGKFDNYFIDYDSSKVTRIMSGIGSGLFELGIFFIPVLYVLIKNSLLVIQKNNNLIFVIILFYSILLNAMPLSNALVGFIIGNLIYLGDKIQKTNENTSSN